LQVEIEAEIEARRENARLLRHPSLGLLHKERA